jgi:hypothetical protein
MLEREPVHPNETRPMFSEEIERKFEVPIPTGASAAEKERLIHVVTDHEIDKLLDDLDPFK